MSAFLLRKSFRSIINKMALQLKTKQKKSKAGNSYSLYLFVAEDCLIVMISDVNVYVVDVYVIHEQLSGGLDLAGACLIPWGLEALPCTCRG